MSDLKIELVFRPVRGSPPDLLEEIRQLLRRYGWLVGRSEYSPIEVGQHLHQTARQLEEEIAQRFKAVENNTQYFKEETELHKENESLDLLLEVMRNELAEACHGIAENRAISVCFTSRESLDLGDDP